jgi:hypothetical protein
MPGEKKANHGRHDGPVHRFREVAGDFTQSHGDNRLIQAVSRHFEAHVGPIGSVFHELFSPLVHVDVFHIATNTTAGDHVFFTTGMAEKPMRVPPGMEDERHAELMVRLPSNWPLHQGAFDDDTNHWPIRWLKLLARFPHERRTWLGWGHSIPNGDPPVLFAGTRFCGILIAPASSLPQPARHVFVGHGREVRLWSLVPLYHEEMELKIKHGAKTLLELFRRAGITDRIDVNRVNVAEE